MPETNSTENLFRFLQLRPAVLVGEDSEGDPASNEPTLELKGASGSEPVSGLPIRLRALDPRRKPADAGEVDAARHTNTKSASAQRAVVELARLADDRYIYAPATSPGETPEARGPLTLNDRGARMVSEGTRTLLADRDLDVTRDALDVIIQVLSDETTEKADDGVGELPTPPPDPPESLPYLRAVGIGDLLVVKQHLTGYRHTDIAHVENVLIGETKSRTHRLLEREEEVVTLERETTDEREHELASTERFELNKETARTVQRDHEFGFGLSVSGKYGPTVEYTSTLDASSSTSTNDSSRSSTRYAKDVVERSLERVVERTRDLRTRTIVREQEETNLHELDNKTKEHIVGVYQFLDKVYESQVFDYGIREMFDFMVPEPASYLWFLEGTEGDLKLPAPPARLDAVVPDFTYLDEGNYARHSARFQADGVRAPPPFILRSSASIVHGGDAEVDAEEGVPRSVMSAEVPIPDGYRPLTATLRPVALTDNHLAMGVTTAAAPQMWYPQGAQVSIGGLEMAMTSLGFVFPQTSPFSSSSKLPIHVLAYETFSYAVSVEVTFVRTSAGFAAWQLDTYQRLATAHEDAVARYESRVADLKAEADAQEAATPGRFGGPPSQNLKTIKAELKKHCLSIVTRQRYEDFDIVEDGNPPWFDFDDAAERGAYTRFFEQAFEWDQMQYVCYPYFWSRYNRWRDRVQRQDVDPHLREFLQAGAARVVVPVRPGFESAVTHYLETQLIWDGDGTPPTIEDPLYLPIIDEIRERTDAPSGEVAVGEHWETVVPTSLVVLRAKADLPSWTRPDTQAWSWEEA